MSSALARRWAVPALLLAAASGAAAEPPSARDVLSRYVACDAPIASYSVPVHLDVRVRKLIGLRFGMNGTQYFKRPGRLALEIRNVPEQYRRLFGEIGTPLTWSEAYTLRVAGGAAGTTHIEGTPKRAGAIARLALDVPADPRAPLQGIWYTHDGVAIAMTIDVQPVGGYQLPRRTQVDLAASGYHVHAVFNYGDYTVNTAVADSLFGT